MIDGLGLAVVGDAYVSRKVGKDSSNITSYITEGSKTFSSGDDLRTARFVMSSLFARNSVRKYCD